ncbi:MAG: C40 family peptidase [Gaiellaceae bacterium]
MSFRLRRLVPALALIALVMVLPPAMASTSGAGSTVPASRPPDHGEGRPTPRTTPIHVSIGELAAKFALEAVGIPYRWGGTSPATGFDCSGLVRWAYGRLGIAIPHNSYALWRTGKGIEPSRMEPGDVLVFSGLGHVGLYVGRGRMVHAPSSGRHVEIVHLASSNYASRLVGARRVAPA